MRKMTKKAVTIAAMSAMTAASASMAFAAEKQETNISSVAKEEEAVNSSAVGEWSGDDVKGWKFTKEDGTKLKDQWAQIDGVWYYFKGETIAQDRFLTLDDKGYFFDENGRLATGWQKINSSMDAYSDIDIAFERYNSTNNYWVHVNEDKEYDYYDFVYCYFDNSGVAKQNEWFQDSTGLWYYFDGNAMVKNVYNYEIAPKNNDAASSGERQYYGFDEEGAMLVGWNYKEVPTTWNDPTADDQGRIWYYYKSNGQMQKAGWMKDSSTNTWYLFANYNADQRWDANGVGTREDDKYRWRIGGYPLIVNSYIASNNNSKYEYFYVDKYGKMVTGVNTVPDDAYKVVFHTTNNGNNETAGTNHQVAYEVIKTGSKVQVNFGSKGAATKGVAGNGYYALDNNNIIKATFDTTKSNNYAWKVNNSVYSAANAFAANEKWNFTVTGLGTPDISIPSALTDGDVISYTLKYSSYANAAAAYGITGSSEETVYVLDTAENGNLIGAAETEISAVTGAFAQVENAQKILANINAQGADSKYYAVVYPAAYPVAVTGYSNTAWTIDGDRVVDAGKAQVVDLTQARNSYEYRNIYKEIKAKEEELSDTKRISSTIEELAKNDLAYAKSEEYKETSKQLTQKIKDLEVTIKTLNVVKKYVEDYLKAYTSIASTVNTDKKIAETNLENAKKVLKEALADLKAAENEILDLECYTKLNKDQYVLRTANVQAMLNDFAVVGELVKGAFIAQDDVYFADGDGNLAKNKAVVVDTSADILYNGTRYNNAYVLFGSDAKGIKGYESTKKSVNIGGVTYWATDETRTFGSKKLTVFVSNMKLDAKNPGGKNPQY